jgi:hypothetical protein
MSAGGGEELARVFADRVFRYNMPLSMLYLALTDQRSSWLRLQPGEVEPRVVEAVGLERIVWSSFWPASPGDVIEFFLSSTTEHGIPRRQRSQMRVRWLSSSPPDERGIAITRQRLGRKFGADLRGMDSDYY